MEKDIDLARQLIHKVAGRVIRDPVPDVEHSLKLSEELRALDWNDHSKKDSMKEIKQAIKENSCG